MLDPTSTATKPPRKLGEVGSSLWQSIQSEYRIDDAAGIELLMQACEASDQIAKLAERIAKDGEVTSGAGSMCAGMRASSKNINVARAGGRVKKVLR